MSIAKWMKCLRVTVKKRSKKKKHGKRTVCKWMRKVMFLSVAKWWERLSNHILMPLTSNHHQPVPLKRKRKRQVPSRSQDSAASPKS